ncbi:MAG TPA: ABC transporter transmembrane domain-containing protein, partial [Burkholderiaceae bacterium]|nr:ABC transporter transmembrane domain-containing protein [Burkholderiaceae bacterium]
FFTVTWLGERVTADLRQAVYAHVLQQPPAYFETTQTGEVLSRLTTDTTLVQTVVGSSLSLGLRNSIMGLGALAMLVWTNPGVMVQVALVIGLVVLPAAWAGRRVRRLSRASQDRVADSSAIAA